MTTQFSFNWEQFEDCQLDDQQQKEVKGREDIITDDIILPIQES